MICIKKYEKSYNIFISTASSFFPYETEKTQVNGHLKISASAYSHQDRNRHSNIAFYIVYANCLYIFVKLNIFNEVVTLKYPIVELSCRKTYYMSFNFLIKFRVVYCRTATLLRRWPTRDFYLKSLFLFLFFLRQPGGSTYSKKNLVSFFIGKLQLKHFYTCLWTCNFTERNSIVEDFLRNFQTFAINYFS